MPTPIQTLLLSSKLPLTNLRVGHEYRDFIVKRTPSLRPGDFIVKRVSSFRPEDCVSKGIPSLRIGDFLVRRTPTYRSAGFFPKRSKAGASSSRVVVACAEERDLRARGIASMSTESISNPRKVVRTLLSKEQPEGDGAVVRRSIGRPEMRMLDPFLLLDHATISPPAGFPDHPHRGFETVSYMLEGKVTHQDFAGHTGQIRAGDVQWMTAGRGIVHSEMPGSKGLHTGLQLWVNLAAKDKMVEPAYQELEAKDIPKVDKDGIKVSVIAGESYGVKSPVFTRTPTMYLDFTLQPGAEAKQAVPEGWNAFVYILEGQATFGDEYSTPIKTYNTAQLGPGDGLYVWNKSGKVCRFLLIGGQPLNEPVVQHGPFVMNTQQQIMEAMRDYQLGRNGFERARGWKSNPPVLA